jgi:hypothetical protein
MDIDANGMLWVKLFHCKNGKSSSENATLIPIRWTSKHRKLKTPSSEKSDEPMGSVHVNTFPSNEHDHHATHVDGDVQKIAHSPINEAPSTLPADAWQCGGVVPVNHSDSSAPAHSQTDGEEDNLCVVCMAHAPDLQLLPCRHDRFCRECMIETICAWVRPEAPSCPLCRGAFHTMVLLLD